MGKRAAFCVLADHIQPSDKRCNLCAYCVDVLSKCARRSWKLNQPERSYAAACVSATIVGACGRAGSQASQEVYLAWTQSPKIAKIAGVRPTNRTYRVPRLACGWSR